MLSYESVTYVLERSVRLRAQIGDENDIVGVVPRGVGSTSPPFTCDVSELAANRRDQDIQNADPGYSNTSLVETYAIGKGLGLDCSLVVPKLLPYIGTVAVARDMDYVLKALGQDKLSYLYVYTFNALRFSC